MWQAQARLKDDLSDLVKPGSLAHQLNHDFHGEQRNQIWFVQQIETDLGF